MFPGYCIVFSFYWKTTLLTERNKWGPKKPVQVVAWRFAVSSDAQLTFVYTESENINHAWCFHVFSLYSYTFVSTQLYPYAVKPTMFRTIQPILFGDFVDSLPWVGLRFRNTFYL